MSQDKVPAAAQVPDAPANEVTPEMFRVWAASRIRDPEGDELEWALRRAKELELP